MSGADVRVLRPEGEIDLDAMQQLHAEWYAVAARKPRCIIVDLSAVIFLDCTGMGLLVALLHCQQAHGGSLVLRQDVQLPYHLDHRPVRDAVTVWKAATPDDASIADR